jgi:hypothetical protein
MGATETQAVSLSAAGLAAMAARPRAPGPQALCVVAAWRETVRLKGKSRMRRESHVRFCEGGGVRFPSATRPIWERTGGSGHNVTFPARQYGVNGERRSFALLRPIADVNAQNRVRNLVLQAYAEHEQKKGETAR